MAKKRTRKPRNEGPYFGLHFDARLTREARGDVRVLLENHVDVSLPVGATHFDVLRSIAQASIKPISVESLSEKLKELKLPRGGTRFGDPAREIEQIVSNHLSHRWWITNKGLVVDEVAPEWDSLSSFDRLVGPLSVQLVENGRLSDDALCSIAQKLDAEGFKLEEHLQPKEWAAVVELNRKRKGSPVRSFASAVKNSRLTYFVRRSICRARDRYKKAVRLQSSLS